MNDAYFVVDFEVNPVDYQLKVKGLKWEKKTIE